jgi:hypothetical protein
VQDNTKRAALAGIALSIMAIIIAYASAFLPGGAPRWAAWAMAMGTAGVHVSFMVLGATRTGAGLRSLKLPVLLVLLILAGGFAVTLLLPAEDGVNTPLFLGLPYRAATIMYGIGLLPLLILPLAYAMTFDELTLSEADMDHVKEAARQRRAAVE